MFRSLLHDFYIAECLYTIYLWRQSEYALNQYDQKNQQRFMFFKIDSAVWCTLLQLQYFKQDCSFDSSRFSLWRRNLISSSFNFAWTVLNLVPSSASLIIQVYLSSCMLHEPPLQFWKMCYNNETVCLLCCFMLLFSRHALENVNIRLSTSFILTENS